MPSWYYEIVAPGFKYNLTDIAAAIGIHQLRRAEEFQRRREAVAARYDAGLAGLPLLCPPPPAPGDRHAWHLYPIRIDDRAPIDRDALIDRLYAAGIGCSVHYIPLHLQPYWRDRYRLQTAALPALAARLRADGQPADLHDDERRRRRPRGRGAAGRAGVSAVSFASATKRALDFAAALAGLVLLAPLLAVVAAWIRLDSPGPVFFRQERVGRGGVPFRIHKFRTMRAAAEAAGPALTVGADPRITRAGAFLRRTKLDELPQLIDVLRGDMSLVGPRPEVPRYVATYPPALRAKVLSVRPGITDPASLQFRDESALLARAADPEREYREVVLPAKLRLAADYVDQATLAGDLRLIGSTLRTLWRRP